jgi:hypothetical protein
MFIHPSIHLEIAHQRQQDLLARSERHRTAKAALTGRHEARGRHPIKPVALREPAPATTVCQPQRANA